MSDAVDIAPGIRQLDTLLGGMEQLTAGFLIDGPMPALVETGSQSSVPAVHAALDALGLGPLDLRWIIVTHIHLDHAGAVGDLAKDFPVGHRGRARARRAPPRRPEQAHRQRVARLRTAARRPLRPDDRGPGGPSHRRRRRLPGRRGQWPRAGARGFARARQAPPRGPRRAHRDAAGRRRGRRAAARPRRAPAGDPAARLRPRAGGPQPPALRRAAPGAHGAHPLRSGRRRAGHARRGRGRCSTAGSRSPSG